MRRRWFDRVAVVTFAVCILFGPVSLRWRNSTGAMRDAPLFWVVIIPLTVSEIYLLRRIR
jgi:hypothetical protein